MQKTIKKFPFNNKEETELMDLSKMELTVVVMGITVEMVENKVELWAR